MTIWVINYIDWKSERENKSWRSSTSRDTHDYVLSVEPVGLIKSIFPSATVLARTLIWSERKCPFSHHLNTYFSNSVFQKSLNGFVAGPWWKQWLLTFFCLLPSLHPSSPPPSILADLFHFLNDFLLLQSLCSQFRPQSWLVSAATHCDRWNESPEKSHLLINAPRHTASQKKKHFSFSFWVANRQEKKREQLFEDHLVLFLNPQLISDVFLYRWHSCATCTEMLWWQWCDSCYLDLMCSHFAYFNWAKKMS